jgi:hypothetical protein
MDLLVKPSNSIVLMENSIDIYIYDNFKSALHPLDWAELSLVFEKPTITILEKKSVCHTAKKFTNFLRDLNIDIKNGTFTIFLLGRVC